MRKIFIPCLLLFSQMIQAQTDSSKWMRAFPITDYMVKLNDSVVVVQLEMPEGCRIAEKQLGVIMGLYNGPADETGQKGYGRCNLVKGDYYYFTIGHNETGSALKKGDLLYMFMEKSKIYFGLIPKLAGHFIRLQDVYEKPFYDRYLVFDRWTETDEDQLMDSLVTDIRFTGKYFLENNASMNRSISEGTYSGQQTLDVMAGCQLTDIKKFLEFMIEHPRKYAGKDWKISEIFATWLINGAPAS